MRQHNEVQCNAWITRVPTESHIADDPSRLQLDHVVVLVKESSVRTCGQHKCARLNVEKMGEATIQPRSPVEKMLQLHPCEGQQMEI